MRDDTLGDVRSSLTSISLDQIEHWEASEQLCTSDSDVVVQEQAVEYLPIQKDLLAQEFAICRTERKPVMLVSAV